MKKLLFIIITFVLFINSSSVSAEETFKTSFSVNDLQWEYIVGDSPIAADGIPLWATDKLSADNWLPCDAPQKGVSNISSNLLWLRTVLPHDKVKEAAIFLKIYNKACEVYLDGKVLFKHGDFKTIDDKHSPGSLWSIVDLPEDYAGKTIYIRMYSLNKFKTGIISKFDIGPKSSFPEKILKQDIDTVLLVGLFVFVGLCSIGISILGKIKDNRRSFLFLGLFSIFIGLWLISTVMINQYFLNAPIFWMYESHIVLYILPVWFCLFLETILNKKFAFILKNLAKGTLFYTIVITLGSAFSIFALPSTMRYFHIFFVLIVLVITFMTAKSLFKGSPIEKNYGISFIILYLFAIIDVIRWYTVTTNNFKFLMQWAMLIFISIMAFSLIMQLVESQNKLEIYSEEIRLKEEILEEKRHLLLEMSNYDKMKTEFFVNVSHELRTPLNIILSTLQLINLYIEKNQISFGQIELPRHLKVMRQNCYRLLRLVNNIIDISKIDSGYMEPDFHNNDIVATVEDTTLSAADYIKSNGIELCFDTNIEEKFMCFDREKIERIILNLLSNAVKFSKPGSTISVELLDADDRVCISVRDTGIGIQSDALQTIFDRFVQVDKSLTRSHEGSGIGLSLVKSLVEVHKGSIIVESEYGKGSVFTVTLPSNLPETKKQHKDNLNPPTTPVEKVYIEFSDIYNF